MKTSLIILLCKLIRFIGKIVGKGSSKPGQIALRLDPQILKKIKMPNYVVAVTGSNGKTSTVEMIAHILRAGGKKIAYNKEGSNQIEGVTTFILSDCTLGGKVKSEILLIETDERFARHTFQYFSPTHYVITNLYRDQLTRNGHPEWVYDIIKESIHDETKLILNADDPLVSCFGLDHKDVVWFGVDRLPQSTAENTSIYNDAKYCPHCKEKMEYEYYHYNHIGNYKCTACELKRNDTQFTVTEANLDDGYIVINGESKISLAFSSIYHLYNTLAAYSVASLLGIESSTIVDAVSNYSLKNGRIVTFTAGEHKGTLLTSKHENSISYDQSIRVAVSHKEGCTVVILVDAVSRKYFTSEISWLWDIDFELLNCDNIKKIVLSGLYCNDLATRFEYCGIPAERLTVISSVEDTVDYVKREAVGHIYVITCFSDKGKFLSKVELDS